MITFRKMAENDLEFFNEVRNSCAEKYLHDSCKFTIGEARKWFLDTQNAYYIIENDGQKIGYFRTSNYSITNKNIYVGADLHEDYRSKGLGYESYKLFIGYLFDTLNLHKISLEVIETNRRAIRLYEKLGFIEEGRKRQEVKKGDIYFNSIVMSILKKEWIEKFVL